MLYIISTPIGNLKDITFRAIETLAKCSYILCEDTRVSKILLNKYNLKIKLVSFHKFNEKKNQKIIINNLKAGKIIGLISDAGTPLMSDPGESLIKACYLENIKVEAIPGPCSIIQALVLSGFDTHPFQFLGFLPKKEKELNYFIKKMLFFDGTSICFETAKRIIKTIEKIAKLDPNRNIAILKEMTKKFEKRIALKSQDMLKYLKKNPMKGEIVLAIEKGELINNLSIEETIKLLQNTFALDFKEAIKIVSNIKNISKNEIYKIIKIK